MRFLFWSDLKKTRHLFWSFASKAHFDSAISILIALCSIDFIKRRLWREKKNFADYIFSKILTKYAPNLPKWFISSTNKIIVWNYAHTVSKMEKKQQQEKMNEAQSHTNTQYINKERIYYRKKGTYSIKEYIIIIIWFL